MGVDVAQLTPHAGLPADYLNSLHSGVELIKIPPFYVISISDSISVAKALVDVSVVVG